MKKKTIYAAVLAAALTLTAMVPASAADPTVTITGSAGERQTDDGSSLRLRYVGDPAPAGYTGNYQHGKSVTTPSPELAPVRMYGTLDVSGMSESGSATIIGLHDRDALATGQTGHKQEAGIYVSYNSRSGGYYDVGLSDGDAGGGEFVQRFVRIPVASLPSGILNVHLVIDGSANPASCASDLVDVPTADGCMTLTVNGATVSDSYGSISPLGVDVELGNGGHPGWYVAFGAAGPVIGVLYDLAISPAIPGLETKDQCKSGGFASFGFANQGQCVSSLQANRRAGR